MVGMLKPEFEEIVTGEAEVREVFGIPRVARSPGAWCAANDHPWLESPLPARCVIIWHGQIASLSASRTTRAKCRAVSSAYRPRELPGLKSGDLIETYEVREIPRS